MLVYQRVDGLFNCFPCFFGVLLGARTAACGHRLSVTSGEVRVCYVKICPLIDDLPIPYANHGAGIYSPTKLGDFFYKGKCWQIFQHHGQMLTNILYMEHMGIKNMSKS